MYKRKIKLNQILAIITPQAFEFISPQFLLNLKRGSNFPRSITGEARALGSGNPLLGLQSKQASNSSAEV